MYEDFKVTDRWTGEELHCTWKGTVVAIATRHADATDVRFAILSPSSPIRAVWIALPNVAWVEQKRLNGKVITDYLAAQTAGRYLKTIVETGYDNGREMYTMTVDEVLEHANAVIREAGSTSKLPSLPVINDDVHPERVFGRLPADNAGPVQDAARSHGSLALGILPLTRSVPARTFPPSVSRRLYTSSWRVLAPSSTVPPLLAMIAVAFLIRTAVVCIVFRGLVDPSTHFGEFGGEIGWTARSIATGHGYTSPFYPLTGPTALVPPGYVFLMAGVFKVFGLYSAVSSFIILVLNSLFSALTCIPVYLTGRDSVNARLGRYAGWLWAVYPFSIYYTAQVWEYALTALLFTTCFYLLLRLHTITKTPVWVGFGGLYGLAALVNPAILIVLPLLFLLPLWKLYRSGSPWLKKALLTTLTVVAVLAPWTVRNTRVMQTFVPIRDGYWLEFYAGNNGDTFMSNAIWAHPATNDGEMLRYKALGETAYLAEKHRLAIDFVSHHPLWFTIATLRRFVRYWTGFWSFGHHYLETQFLDIPNLFFCTAVTFFMLAGAHRLLRRNREAALPFLVVIAIFPVAYYMSHASMDYRQPIEPEIVVLASIGIFNLESCDTTSVVRTAGRAS